MRQRPAEGAFISALPTANLEFTCHSFSFGPLLHCPRWVGWQGGGSVYKLFLCRGVFDGY